MFLAAGHGHVSEPPQRRRGADDGPEGAGRVPGCFSFSNALPGPQRAGLPRQRAADGRARLVRGVGDDVGVEHRLFIGAGAADAVVAGQIVAGLRRVICGAVRSGITQSRVADGAVDTAAAVHVDSVSIYLVFFRESPTERHSRVFT